MREIKYKSIASNINVGIKKGYVDDYLRVSTCKWDTRIRQIKSAGAIRELDVVGFPLTFNKRYL